MLFILLKLCVYLKNKHVYPHISFSQFKCHYKVHLSVLSQKNDITRKKSKIQKYTFSVYKNNKHLPIEATIKPR